MAKIKVIELDGQYIYMQVDDSAMDIEAAPVSAASNDEFESKGDSPSIGQHVVNNLTGLISTMTKTTVNAIQEAANAQVDKVTLEFSVTLSSEAGFIVASGKAQGAIKVSVQLNFPQKS